MIISSDYGRLLQVLSHDFAGNNYLPSMFFFYYRKSLFKIVLGQNFFNCQPIFKIIAAHFRTNYAPNSTKKIVYLQLNEIEDIREIPFSESRNYTLAFFSFSFFLHISTILYYNAAQ